MGSIVVQKAIEENRWPQAAPLFSAVTLTEPDADDVGHEVWLEALATREKTFVTVNRDDHVLKRSTDGRAKDRQALGLGAPAQLAKHARYIDLSNMGPLGKKDDDHEVFGKGAMNGDLNVCRLFQQLLTGADVVLDHATNVESIERDVVYRLRGRQEPGAACLKIPKLPKF